MEETLNLNNTIIECYKSLLKYYDGSIKNCDDVLKEAPDNTERVANLMNSRAIVEAARVALETKIESMESSEQLLYTGESRVFGDGFNSKIIDHQQGRIEGYHDSICLTLDYIQKLKDMGKQESKSTEARRLASIKKMTRRVNKLNEKSGKIATRQREFVMKSVKNDIKKMSSEVQSTINSINNENKLQNVLEKSKQASKMIEMEKDLINKQLETFKDKKGVNAFFSRTKLKAEKLFKTPRWLALQAKEGTLSGGAEVIIDAKQKFDNSKLGEKLSKLRNIKPAIIKGWTEFKAVLKGTATESTAKAV